jgi:hypothetical protein
MSVAIIGGGAGGILVCLELIRAGKEPSQITLIDPYLDGGALNRHWGGIMSNTRWVQITEAMSLFPSAQKPIQELNAIYTPENTILLKDLGWLLAESLRPHLSNVNVCLDEVRDLHACPEGWKIRLSNGSQVFTKVFLCQGGQPKRLDFGKPMLPLEIALDPARVGRLVRPNQSVAVFGLAHSGTLVCKHLLALGVKVYGIYTREKPFSFDRDGIYDGIKQESAEIADSLLASPNLVEFVPYKDAPRLFKILQKVNWVVSATGFQASPIQIYDAEGKSLSWMAYSPETAEVAPNLYGFGLAYPGITILEGKTYQDVSIPSFINQIRRCLPTILSKS